MHEIKTTNIRSSDAFRQPLSALPGPMNTLYDADDSLYGFMLTKVPGYTEFLAQLRKPSGWDYAITSHVVINALLLSPMLPLYLELARADIKVDVQRRMFFENVLNAEGGITRVRSFAKMNPFAIGSGVTVESTAPLAVEHAVAYVKAMVPTYAADPANEAYIRQLCVEMFYRIPADDSLRDGYTARLMGYSLVARNYVARKVRFTMVGTAIKAEPTGSLPLDQLLGTGMDTSDGKAQISTLFMSVMSSTNMNRPRLIQTMVGSLGSGTSSDAPSPVYIKHILPYSWNDDGTVAEEGEVSPDDLKSPMHYIYIEAKRQKKPLISIVEDTEVFTAETEITGGQKPSSIFDAVTSEVNSSLVDRGVMDQGETINAEAMLQAALDNDTVENLLPGGMADVINPIDDDDAFQETIRAQRGWTEAVPLVADWLPDMTDDQLRKLILTCYVELEHYALPGNSAYDLVRSQNGSFSLVPRTAQDSPALASAVRRISKVRKLLEESAEKGSVVLGEALKKVMDDIPSKRGAVRPEQEKMCSSLFSLSSGASDISVALTALWKRVNAVLKVSASGDALLELPSVLDSLVHSKGSGAVHPVLAAEVPQTWRFVDDSLIIERTGSIMALDSVSLIDTLALDGSIPGLGYVGSASHTILVGGEGGSVRSEGAADLLEDHAYGCGNQLSKTRLSSESFASLIAQAFDLLLMREVAKDVTAPDIDGAGSGVPGWAIAAGLAVCAGGAFAVFNSQTDGDSQDADSTISSGPKSAPTTNASASERKYNPKNM